MTFVPRLVVVLPEMLHEKNSSYTNTTTWINITFSTSNTFSLFAILHFSLLLTLNRFVALISPKYNTFFESSKLNYLIAFVWLSLLAITVVDFYYCDRRFAVQYLSWISDCEKSNGKGKLLVRMRFYSALFIPSAMFVIYVAIFCSIYRKRQKITKMHAEQNRNEAEISQCERSMLIQAAWICEI
ncbi:7 transmembrane receptor (rhodopsin family) protein [Acanthocheilonema viteae]